MKQLETIWEKPRLKTTTSSNDSTSQSDSDNDDDYYDDDNHQQYHHNKNRNNHKQQSLIPIHPTTDPDNYLFPFCIIWTPLSLISVLFPFIGQVCICTSEGVIYDFAGSHYSNQPEISFSTPTKYVFIKPTSSQMIRKWNETVTNVHMTYNNDNYSLFFNNCHSYCAYVLNTIKYNGRSDYNMFDVLIMVTFESKYISLNHYVRTYIGFILFCLMILVVVYSSELGYK